MDVGNLLTFAASKFPNRTAIVDGNKRLTYREFNDRVNRLANALLKMGLKKGEKVAALLFNSSPLVEVYFATARAGGVFSPMNFRFAPAEVESILNHSDARFFVFGEEFSDLVKAIRPELPQVGNFISVGDRVKDAYDYESLLEKSKNKEPAVRFSEKDVCQLMYTSGTTGRPKGALITHGNILWNLINNILGREDKEGEVSLVIGPL